MENYSFDLLQQTGLFAQLTEYHTIFGGVMDTSQVTVLHVQGFIIVNQSFDLLHVIVQEVMD